MENNKKCYVCNFGPHGSADHTYTTWAEAEKWFTDVPDAEPGPVEIDGVIYSYGS